MVDREYMTLRASVCSAALGVPRNDDSAFDVAMWHCVLLAITVLHVISARRYHKHLSAKRAVSKAIHDSIKPSLEDPSQYRRCSIPVATALGAGRSLSLWLLVRREHRCIVCAMSCPQKRNARSQRHD